MITIERQKMKIDWEKIKNIFKNEEFYIVLFFIGAFGLIAWFKGGGDSDWFFAIFFGFIIWSEIPKILTLFGAALVILSSLIIFVRESQLKKQIINLRS